MAALSHDEGNKENEVDADDDEDAHEHGHTGGEGMYEDEAIDMHDERAHEIQGYMQDLLNDLGLFKRKIGDDKSRFLTPLGERVNH